MGPILIVACSLTTAGPGEAGDGIVVAAARDPARLCGFAVSDGAPLLAPSAGDRGGVLAPLPGAPCAIAGDDRRGLVFVDVLPSSAPPPQSAGTAAPAPALPLRRPILAFQWGYSRSGTGRLEPLGPVEVPTDDATAPRPLAVVPPAPGQHTSFLVVAGWEGGLGE